MGETASEPRAGAGEREPGRLARAAHYIKGAFDTVYKVAYGFIGGGASGIWAAAAGPASKIKYETYGAGSTYTLYPGQTAPIDGGTCNLQYVNNFGGQYQFDVSQYTPGGLGGRSMQQWFFNVLNGGSFSPTYQNGDPSSATNICGDTMKITLQSVNANGSVNVLVQAASYNYTQGLVALASIAALSIGALIAISHYRSKRRVRKDYAAGSTIDGIVKEYPWWTKEEVANEVRFVRQERKESAQTKSKSA